MTHREPESLSGSYSSNYLEKMWDRVANIDTLAAWFFWWTTFSIVAMIICMVDLRMIRDAAARFEKLKGGKAFLVEVETRHVYEMKILVPIAIAFNVVALALAFFTPPLPTRLWSARHGAAVYLAWCTRRLYP